MEEGSRAGGTAIGAAAPTDGRAQRRQRTRDAAVEAILDLLAEGVTKPTAAQVSERSGVSMRSIFRLESDMEGLLRSVIDRQAVRVTALMASLPHGGPLDARIAALAANRAELFETVAPVRRLAVRLAAESPTVREQLARAAAVFRSQVVRHFAAELAGAPPATVDALDLATSWEAWERLRTIQGLDVEAASATVTALVTALVTRAAPPD